MSKLYFRYGAMNSGKSTNLMQVREFDTCLNINCIRSLDTAYFFVKFYNFILRTLSYCIIIKGVR